MRRKKINVNGLLNYKPKTIPFEGRWYDLVGNPEASGSWIIWGQSGQGKSRFAIQLTKYLALKGLKIAYISLEEGLSATLQKAFLETGVADCKRKIEIWNETEIADLNENLKKQRSANVIIIDSLQYLGLNYGDYKTLRDTFRKKLFIFISHAKDGNEPQGHTASKIRYDASVKISVKDFIAYATSRYGGGIPFTIWSEGTKTNNKS